MEKDHEALYYLEGLPLPETPGSGETPSPWEQTNVIGKKLPRVDAYERVSGSAVYPSDIVLPGMLYVAVLRSPHPHAEVKKVDAVNAETMRGVHAVFSPYSAEADTIWPYSKEIKTKLFDTHIRFEGETIAAVAAETPYQAWDAVRAISVEYNVLPFLSDYRKALEDDAVKVQEAGNKVIPTQVYERGDIDRGFSDADIVLEKTYTTACEIHAPMELHGCVAKWDGDELTLWESTQGVYGIQSRVAQILEIPLSKVRVIGHYMGGGFGSKLQPGKYTIIAALLAKKTGRPVKLFLTREETLLAAGNRPPCIMHLKAGIKKDGTLTAFDFSTTATGGAYPARGSSLLDWLVKDLYLCPNVRTEVSEVYIHAGPSRPFRAPGHPQGAWALEQMIDDLASAIQMDPVDVRLKNIPAFSQGREGNPPYTTSGLRECLEEGAKSFGWTETRNAIEKNRGTGHIRRGAGMASCLWIAGGGRPPATIIVRLFSDGSVNLNMGASDIGTGTKTIMSMVVSEELGIKPEMIQIEHADTGTTQYASPSGGSKTVPTESPAVRAATIHVKQQLLKLAAKDLEVGPEQLMIKNGEIFSGTDPGKKLSIPDISELKKQGVIVGIGYRDPNPEGKVVNPFGAQFCELEVNMKTGEVKILRFLATHESGRVMNRLTFDNQVFGGITMGIGFGMTESRVLDGHQTGKMLNKNWHDYKIPTSMDVPSEMVSQPIEINDPEANIAGCKGVGEPVTIPTAAAIANAIYHATGVRIASTPASPAHICQLLSAQQKER